jgi:glucose-6-phosphate isomerase
MAYEALRHYTRRDMTFRFVSNVDSTDFAEATHLSADETLSSSRPRRSPPSRH